MNHFQDDDRFVLGEIHSDVKTLLATATTHDERIRSLERHRWLQRGLFLGVGAWITTRFPVLSEYLK